ncbi:hypothetical protein BVX95_02260 [archaeon D22]|nr:hypothetical protein BVX95_02260 [archaeon D22]
MSRYGKKGYLRTLEVMIAFIITFGFVLVILQTPVTSQSEEKKHFLIELMDDNGFRSELVKINASCIYKSDNTTLTREIEKYLIEETFAICNDFKPTLPKRSVYVDRAYFTGNVTHSMKDPVIKLYYWI